LLRKVRKMTEIRELSWNEVVQLLEKAEHILSEGEERIEKAKDTDEENESTENAANELCALFDEYKLPKYNFLFNNEADHLEIHIPAFWINKNKKVWFEVTPYKWTMIDEDISIELIEKHYAWAKDDRNPAFSFEM